MAMTLPRIIVFVVLTHTAFGAARVTSSLYALSNKASPFTVGVMLAHTPWYLRYLPYGQVAGSIRWDRSVPCYWAR